MIATKFFPAFGPASIDIDEVCICYRRLRTGKLLSVMMIPSVISVDKALANCLFVAGALGEEVCCRRCETEPEHDPFLGGHDGANYRRKTALRRKVSGLTEDEASDLAKVA